MKQLITLFALALGAIVSLATSVIAAPFMPAKPDHASYTKEEVAGFYADNAKRQTYGAGAAERGGYNVDGDDIPGLIREGTAPLHARDFSGKRRDTNMNADGSVFVGPWKEWKDGDNDEITMTAAGAFKLCCGQYVILDAYPEAEKKTEEPKTPPATTTNCPPKTIEVPVKIIVKPEVICGGCPERPEERHVDCPNAFRAFARGGAGNVDGTWVNTAEELAELWSERYPERCEIPQPPMRPRMGCPPPRMPPPCPRHCRQWTPQGGCRHMMPPGGRRPPLPYRMSGLDGPGGFHAGVSGGFSYRR